MDYGRLEATVAALRETMAALNGACAPVSRIWGLEVRARTQRIAERQGVGLQVRWVPLTAVRLTEHAVQA